MRKLFACLLATLLLVTAGTVYAGERAGAFSVSPFVGGYTFDGVQQLETAPVYGLRLGIDLTKSFGVELVGDYLATEKSRLDKASMNAISYRLDFLFNFMADGPFVPYIAVGGGGMTLGHGDKFDLSPNTVGLRNTPFGGRNTFATANAGLGFKYFMTDSVAFRLDARELAVFPEAHNSLIYNTEYTAGLTFLFGGEKPAPPPPPPAPTSSLSVTPGSITKGGTATLNWSSQNAKNCDITPGIGPVNTQGSMTVTPSADTAYTLSCNGPGGTSSSSANITVAAPPPPAPTSSITITPSSVTKGESATLNWNSQNATDCDIQPGIGPVKPQGSMTMKPAADTTYTLTCSGPGGKTVSATNITVAVPPPEMLCYKINIEFDTAKWNIKPKYHDELAKLAKFLNDYPGLTGVIEGHTDNVGGTKYNQKLSEKRAQSVRDYLVKNLGIDGSRLTSKGFGESKPVADNSTAAGRQENRRVVANFECVEKKQ